MEVIVSLYDPLSLPFPLTILRKEDRVAGQLDFAIDVAPIRPLVWEKYILKNAHPDTLILKRLVFPYFIIIRLIVMIDRVRPIPLDILHRFFKQLIPLF